MSAPDVAVITAILGVILVIAQRLLPDRTQIKTAEVNTAPQAKTAEITATVAEQKSIFELGQQLRAELRDDLARAQKDLETARTDLNAARTEIVQLRAENQQVKAENVTLKDRIAKVEAENSELRTRVAALELAQAQ